MTARTALHLKCQCGVSSFSATVDNTKLPLCGVLCHCNTCRHGLGTLCNMALIWPSHLPEDTDTLSKYILPNGAATYFCGTCGTAMFWHRSKEPRLTMARTGVLRNADKLVRFEKHIYLSSTPDGGLGEWLHEMDGRIIERRSKGPESEELPRRWRSETVYDNGGDKRLRAYCLCKGVEFYITRPHGASSNLEAPLPDALENSPEAEKCKIWWLKDHNRYLAGTCACNSCRLAAGVDIVQWAFVPAANIKLSSGEAFRKDFGTIRQYQSSNDVTRCFCGRCGANIFWTSTARPELIDVAVGLLDAPSGALAEAWLCWVRERVSFEEEANIPGLAKALGEGLIAWRDSVSIAE